MIWRFCLLLQGLSFRDFILSLSFDLLPFPPSSLLLPPPPPLSLLLRYEDKNSASGWATKQQVEFVSAYAHQKNPNEDMAESISYYVKNPDKLLSRAPRKFAFIRDRLMHGTRYVSSIREDLTFEVSCTDDNQSDG